MANTRLYVPSLKIGGTQLHIWPLRTVAGEKVRQLDKAMTYSDLANSEKCDLEQLRKFLDMSTPRTYWMRLKDLQTYLVWAAVHTRTHTHTHTRTRLRRCCCALLSLLPLVCCCARF